MAGLGEILMSIAVVLVLFSGKFKKMNIELGNKEEKDEKDDK